MEKIGKIIEKLKDLTQTLIDILFGPEGETEAELIPIPVRDNPRSRY